ncbi:ferrous iron transport protein B [Cytobacillus sp. IB215316]|uniref:ferrous iron transport protein B n=1 Tax=Cytobacillus sp. IB215316 TaxID=3097354 RepID=UPI002A16C17C|nr:ferrous iron transport protein B [Cytobacillus sp. IB215316]MDX8361376.1 ferrous iron transport protein B [Cytobacillus sp. IB215316]
MILSSQIALFGNPNTGKTSLFNNLTGSYEYVGNWSGVTVEKKIGILRDKQGQLIDLPGVYSLNPLSKDEEVVTNFMLTASFEKIVNIVDASQLKRNLHLTVQLLEFEKPIIIGLNMVDVAKKRGLIINAEKLADKLDVIVAPIIARTGMGCEELTANLALLNESNERIFTLNYGAILEEAIQQIEEILPDNLSISKRWLAIQYLEGNKQVESYVRQFLEPNILEQIKHQTEQMISKVTESGTIRQFIYHIRDQFIGGLIVNVMEVSETKERTTTELIDNIVTNKYFGLPLFLLFMYIIFMLTFDWLGSPLADLLDGFISGPISSLLANGLEVIGASEFIQSLVLDGIVAGVGGVLVFVPQIFILFLLISFLEDSGYLARVAVVMDRLMEAIGLNGKAFIPMIIGFGCNVPGVMAARTIEQPKERLLTILLTPLMSCSARLPVYALFAGTFFIKHQAVIVFSLYVLGIVVAMVLAKLFSSIFFKGEKSLFVMELPPYRIPQLLTLSRSTWEKGKGFLKKAGTIIFAGSVFIWLLTYFGPSGVAEQMDNSFLALIGGYIAPLFAPLGFGTWQAAASLMTGFFAKEVVVSTMNIIYYAPNTDSLQGMLSEYYTPISAISFMSFVLLYVPCLATVATIKKESNSTKWTLFSVGYALVIAYVISLLIYQVGKMFL